MAKVTVRQVQASSDVGTPSNVLIESPEMGRTESFAEVRFEDPQPVGQIVPAQITGTRATYLTARTGEPPWS